MNNSDSGRLAHTIFFVVTIVLAACGTYDEGQHEMRRAADDAQQRRQAFLDSLRRSTDSILGANQTHAPPAAVSSPVDRRWYEGGTLHQATVAEWNGASDSNKLATAADFATSALHPRTTEEVRTPAREMKDCISTAAQSAPPHKQVSELGAVCAVMMGW